MKIRLLTFAFLALMALSLAPAVSAATPSARWLQFLNWSLDHSDRVSSVLSDISVDIDFDDYYTGAIDATVLKSVTRQGITWLDAHKAAACYKSVWIYDRSYLSHTNLAAQYMVKGFRNYSVYWLNRSTAETKLATAAIKRETVAIGKVNC